MSREYTFKPAPRLPRVVRGIRRKRLIGRRGSPNTSYSPSKAKSRFLSRKGLVGSRKLAPKSFMVSNSKDMLAERQF